MELKYINIFLNFQNSFTFICCQTLTSLPRFKKQQLLTSPRGKVTRQEIVISSYWIWLKLSDVDKLKFISMQKFQGLPLSEESIKHIDPFKIHWLYIRLWFDIFYKIIRYLLLRLYTIVRATLNEYFSSHFSFFRFHSISLCKYFLKQKHFFSWY